MILELLLKPILYMLFISVFWAYKISIICKSLATNLFKIIYIEQICGFQSRQKIIDRLKTFQKLPQQITMSFDANFNQEKQSKKRIYTKQVFQHLDILLQTNLYKKINLYFFAISEQFDLEIQAQIQRRQNKFKTQLCIVKKSQQCEKLTKRLNKIAPLVICYSSYQSLNCVPPKYLIDAELFFNNRIENCTKYDIFRPFQQYSVSKQRNGI